MKSEDVERVRLSLPSYYHDESCECGSCESTREDHAAFERLVAENAQLKARIERAGVAMFKHGYSRGHHDTVESSLYTPWIAHPDEAYCDGEILEAMRELDLLGDDGDE